jgi:uncharacterized repeat protein (TIGR03803 family)
MQSKIYFVKMAALTAASFFAVLMTETRAAAQTETVLHSMKATEGISPMMGLIFDSSGDLYGAAAEGGSSNNGSIFELMPQSGGTYTEKTLHSFNGGSGGGMPLGSVIFDSAGNLYGTVKLGGSHGVGVVFELKKSGTTWTETVLHNFGGTKDGQFPTSSLVFDSAGNLYGTTEGGGTHGNGSENVGGTAYKLAPKSGGGFTETVIHSFGAGTDGVSPRCNLILDSSGNLYGTAFQGGSVGAGMVFELSPQSGGGWTEKTLHSFAGGGSDGSLPSAGLIFDTAGNLYGTTVGSSNGGGTVFKLTPSGGSWTESVLFNFVHTFYQPSFPYSNVILDSVGNLYGATLQGTGLSNGFNGTVFELTLVSGIWNQTTLYSFDGTHGAEPGNGALIFDSSGNLYGAAQAGGANKDGVVFKIVP